MSALFCSICQSRIYLNLHHSHLLQIFQGERLDQGTHPAQSSNRIREEENGGDQMVSKKEKRKGKCKGKETHPAQSQGGGKGRGSNGIKKQKRKGKEKDKEKENEMLQRRRWGTDPDSIGEVPGSAMAASTTAWQREQRIHTREGKHEGWVFPPTMQTLPRVGKRIGVKSTWSLNLSRILKQVHVLLKPDFWVTKCIDKDPNLFGRLVSHMTWLPPYLGYKALALAAAWRDNEQRQTPSKA